MRLEPFQMERMQSTWEHVVAHNLSESGVSPVTLDELLSDTKDRERLLRTELGYSQTNGTSELRRAIAALYPGAGEENILVTNGTSEANFLVTCMLIEPGDEAVVMLPNYMQIWGLARAFGAEVRSFHLIEERNWAPDLYALERSISPRTKLIAVCHPNNPTGAMLSENEMDRVIDAARRSGGSSGSGAWLLADEVYRGAELARDITPTFWGRYDRVVITSGLSKAYGLPGLRIGWIVSTPELVARAWSYHDYTTIAPSTASDLLARVALRPENRRKLLARTRHILNSNYPILRDWVNGHADLFSLVPPQAGAIAYLRYNLGMNSLDLAERLRQEKNVLIVPGDHFRMGNYLRIGYGGRSDHLRAGLEQISRLVSELRQALQ